MNLAEQIDAKRAELEALERAARQATCVELGRHDMQSRGGCNAGCDDLCICSVPVHECSRCGECDYGDNDEAREVRKRCAEKRALEPNEREAAL